ncbi:A/G-specific adenine glycosylase [Tenacibaculum sp. SG-28]|uniref:A/G-specific adenine glycosylase n=1 Tax=Tenacibaculum sp. SG-28 TaxID=754426 RepID=UPI000CF4049E|nr:A/G-specific adenine glycosylase [Tenacibaculum sp. SG-28]PQJ22006.1 A/G-specific adenine glycosylase [Tenacibaculum sp. SG-28]
MIFNRELTKWYVSHQRNLPWRSTKNPYFVWLSEIMLQQTKVSQGLPYYLKFVAVFPTVFDLADASESEVLKLWQGLGYYSRARNLHHTAKYVATELNGVFPNNYKGLLQLKGVGEYTASAIASICYKEPVAVVDGNVYRVLARVFGVHTATNSTQGIKEFKQLANSLLDVNAPGNYNQAIMDFGAIQCTPKKPKCTTCIYTRDCFAYLNNQIDVLPFKEKKVKVKKRYFNYLVTVTQDNTTIIEERKGNGIWQGLYQFPLVEGSMKMSRQMIAESSVYRSLFPTTAEISLFNTKEIIHKLSHQHLHTQFWIVKTNTLSAANQSWLHIQEKPVPVLIANFLSEFLKERQ